MLASSLLDKPVNSYAEIAAKAFGKRSMYVLDVLLILALFGPIIANFIIVGDMGVSAGLII
jgi:hypothetical protein